MVRPSVTEENKSDLQTTRILLLSDGLISSFSYKNIIVTEENKSDLQTTRIMSGN